MKRIISLVTLGCILVFACDPPEVEVAVSSVSVTPSSVELTVGESTRLSATVSPADATDKTVTWSTSGASVATVSPSGEVTAVAVGSANITASAGGKSAVCKVTVVNPAVSVSSVTLDKERLDLTVGGTAKLTATVSPADASDKSVTWESSDPGVATVDGSGNVKALKGGTSTVTAKAGGKSASALVDVMDVTPTSFEVGADGGDIKVTVVTTRKYRVDSKPEWITEGSVSGQVHTFTVSANGSLAERSGSIVIVDEGGTKFTCSVKQAGAAPVFSISPERVEVAAEGGTFDVTVTANVPYHVSSTPDWVTQKSQKDNVYTFEVAANAKPEERSGVVVICDEVGTCLSCSVKQAGAEVYLTVDPENVEFDLAGGTVEIAVSTNEKWTVTSSSSWCEVTPASGEGDGSFTVKAGEFRSEGTRSATVTVKAGELVRTVQVGQDGIVPFSVAPSSVNIGSEGGSFEIKVKSTWGYHINELPGWIKEVSVNGKVHTFKVEANPDIEARSGSITFCDDESTCLSVSVRQDGHTYGPDEVDWRKEFFHKSLLIRFTGVWDSFAPLYVPRMKAAQASRPGKFEFINFYSDEILWTFDFSPLMKEYYHTDGVDGVVDGRTWLNYLNFESTESILLGSLRDVESKFPTVSTIGWTSSFSGQTLDMEVYMFAKEAGDYKLTVILVEDGIIGFQHNAWGEDYEEFRHDCVARAAVTSVTGEPVKTTKSNTMVRKSFSVTVPSSCVKENLRIVAFVQRAYGRLPKIDVSDFDGWFVDNCTSGKAGVRHMPAIVSDAGGDNEDFTEGKPVNW